MDNSMFALRLAAYCPQLAAALVSSGLLDEVLAATQTRQTTAGRAERQRVRNK